MEFTFSEHNMSSFRNNGPIQWISGSSGKPWLLMQQWSPLGPFKHTMNHPENRSISEDPSLQDAALWCQPWKQLCRTRPEWIFDYLQYRLGRIGNTLYKTLKLNKKKRKKKKGPTRDPELKTDCQGGLNSRTECVSRREFGLHTPDILYPP